MEKALLCTQQELRALAEFLNFETLLEKMMRDSLVRGVGIKHIQVKSLEEASGCAIEQYNVLKVWKQL